MYQLEERILFDGAAAVDLAVAQQEQHAQEAQTQAQAQAEPAVTVDQNQTQNPHEATPVIPADTSSAVPTTDTSSADHSTASLFAPIDASNPSQPAEIRHVNVLVVSESLENADALFNSANSDTIVLRYNEKTTSGNELLQEITDALHGEKADSIGFVTDKAHDGAISIFADSDTSENTLSSETQQDFWNGVEGLLAENGKVNLFASDLASTENGRHLVDSLSQITNHRVAASNDMTGDKDAGGNWELEYVAKGTGSVDLIEEYFNRESIQSFDHRIEKPTEIAFIDSSVQDIDTILKGIGDQAEIVYLNKDHAFEQITSYLQGRTDVDAIHLVSEGTSAEFYLGSETINSDFIDSHHEELAVWGNAMSPDGDIHIYGCNVAKDQVGKDLVNQISIITGADVAASVNRTGIAGDWNLEFTSGQIETAGFAVGDYNHNLITLTVRSANDYLVTNPLGVSSTSPTLTFREALLISLNGDTIAFAGAYTINLVDTLVIDTNITINGPVAIDAHGAFRALYIDAPMVVGSSVSINNMTVLNGHSPVSPTEPSAGSGGGILISDSSTVNMTDIQVTGSSAIYGGGIYNAGILNLSSDLDISNNTASNSGGGIYNEGTLTFISNINATLSSDVSNNTASGGHGGGIYNSGSLNINSSSGTFSFNLLANSAGGNGGGIYSNTGDIALTDLYLDGNSAGQDGGAIYVFANKQQAPVLFTNIVASDNTAIQDGGALYFTNGSSALVGTAVFTLAGSDFSQNSAVQNGGAIYIENSVGNVTFGSGDISNNTAGQDGGGIYIATSKGTVALSNIVMFSNIATQGSGGGVYLSNLSPSAAATNSLTLDGCNFSQNSAGQNGGALSLGSSSGNVSIKSTINNSTTVQSEFLGNSAMFGGALYFESCTGNISIDFVNISSNTADEDGGAVYMENSSGVVTFSDIEMAGNSAGIFGGGIYYSNATPGVIRILTSNISNNTAEIAGGGIYLVKGLLTIQNCTLAYNGFDGNTEGGAIYSDSGNLNISLSTIAYNMGSGAAIFMNNPDTAVVLTINNTIIYNLDTEYAAGSFTSQIYLADASKCRSTFSTTNNIYSHYYLDADPDPAHLNSLDLGDVNSNRMIGSSPTKATDIQSNLWMDETLRYHANYRTMALAILSQDSWAIGKGTGGNTYDQRGNTRGTTWTWDQTKQTWTKGSGYTIGAFEPIFHVIVNSKTTVDPKTGLNVGGDDSSLTLTSDQNARYFINALGGIYYFDENTKQWLYSLGGSGLTLREAAYWVDTRVALDENSATYYVDPTEGSNNFTAADYNSRYIGFDTKVFSSKNTSNNIGLIYGDIYVGGDYWGNLVDRDAESYRDIAVAYLVRNPDNSGNILYHDDTLRSHSDPSRITVSVAVGSASSLFVITSPSVAAINNLTLSGGTSLAGGGIVNHGGTDLTRTTLTNVIVQNCTATATTISLGGAVYNNGFMNIYDSSIINNTVSAATANGGGIYSSGTMNIDRTQVNGNTSSSPTSNGGGIYNTGSMTITRSEISGNSLTGTDVLGGGIYNSSADFWIANSTIAENTISGTVSAYGSGIYNGGTLLSYYNTIANNEASLGQVQVTVQSLAGLYQANTAQSSLFLSNTIVVDNYGNTSSQRQRADIYDDATAVDASSDYNIVGAYNIDIGYEWNVDNNIVGNRDTLIPQYGFVSNLNMDFTAGLQYYGALTRSYRVLGGSVAMDTGIVVLNPGFFNNETFYTDQRGMGRGIEGDATNRGSFDHLDNIYVRSTFDSSTPRTGFDFTDYKPLWESSTLTLREAVMLADDTSHVKFKEGWQKNGSTFIDPLTGSKTIVSNELNAKGNLIINLVGGELPVTRSIDIDGMFSWNEVSTANATLGAVTVSHIGSISQLTAGANSRIFNVDCPIPNWLSTVAISNFTMSGGNVTGNGGGIFSASNLTLDNVTIQSSTARQDAAGDYGLGGGVYSAEGSLILMDSVIGGKTAATGNSALMGGGIYSVSYNSTGGYALFITKSSILNNSAKNSITPYTMGDGGGIYLQSGDSYIEYSTIGMNKAVSDGGGIIVATTSNLTMFNSTVSNNSAGRTGGGISFYSNNPLTLDFVTIANNQSGWNVNNTASGNIYAYGGGIFMNSGTLALSNSILAQNYRGKLTGASLFHDDLYTNASANNISNSVYGATDGSGTIIVDVNSVQVTDWSTFKGKLDTKLTDNGGMTMTVYVFDSPYFQLNLQAGSGYDQTHLGTFTSRITSGALENSVSKTLYYVSGDIGMGRDGGSIWVGANNPSVLIFESDGVLNAADTVFAFDDSYYNPLLFGKASLNNNWTLHSDTANNPNSQIELQNNGWLTINPGGVLAGRLIVKNSSTLELATPWIDNINLKVEHVPGVSNTTVIYDSVVTISIYPDVRSDWYIQTVITQETVTDGAIKTTVEYDNLILTGNLVASHLTAPLNSKIAYGPLSVHGDFTVGTVTGGTTGDLHDNVNLSVRSTLNINPESGSHVLNNYGKIAVSKDLTITVDPSADLTMGGGGTVNVSGNTTIDGTVTMANISILSKTVNLDNAYIIATDMNNVIGMSAQSLLLTDNATDNSPTLLRLGLDRLTVDAVSRLQLISGGTVTTEVGAPAENIEGTLALSGKIGLDNSFSVLVKSTATLELGGTVKIMDANIVMDNSLIVYGNITVDRSVVGDISITSNFGSVVIGSDVTADSKFTGGGKGDLIITANTDASVGGIYSVVNLSVTSNLGDVHLLNSITVSGNVFFETLELGRSVLVHKAFATDAAKNINTTPTAIIVTAGKDGTINVSNDGTGYSSYLGDGSELRLSAGSTVNTNALNTVNLNRSFTLLKGIYLSDGVNLTESGSFINAGTFDNPSSNLTLVNGSITNSKILKVSSIAFSGTGSLINSLSTSVLNADVVSMYGGSVTNAGVFAVTEVTLTNSGALNNNSGSMTVSTLTMETGTFTNRTAFTADTGITFTNAGKINNYSSLTSGFMTLTGATLNNMSSTIMVADITITDNGSLYNSGKMTNAVIITITGNGSLVNTGKLVNADTVITFQDAASLTNSATLTVNSITFSGSGSLNNNGGALSAVSIGLESGNLNNKAVLSLNATAVNITSGNLINTGTIKDLGGSVITLLAGDLTNKGSLTVGTIYMVADELVNSGTMNVKDSLMLNEVNLTLSGTVKVAALELVKDSVLIQGKLTVQDFYFGTKYDPFTGTPLSLMLKNAATLEITNSLYSASEEHFFITQANGKVWVKPGAAGTPVSVFLTDDIANAVTQIDLSSSTATASRLVGLGTFSSVTTNGKYNGAPAIDTDIVNRTWTITRSDSSKLTSTFHWTLPEERMSFDSNSASLYMNTGTGAGTTWTQVSGFETRNPFDYTNTNITKSGSYVIGNDTIAMNDNSQMGTLFDELKEKFIDVIFGTKEQLAGQQQVAEAQEKSAMEDMFSQMANRGNLMERNKLFKSDVDLGLEVLLAV